MKILVLFLVTAILPFTSVFAKDLTFAVVPKFYGVFFDQSKLGCKDAAERIDGVECIYRGPKVASVRTQDKIINDLVKEGVDGIAVAVTTSDFLVNSSMQAAMRAGIPVVTYDSDFDADAIAKNDNLRRSYIGTNNFDLGRALGDSLKKLRPDGGLLIMQTGRPDAPNLNLRIMGVRSALSGKTYAAAPGDRLEGDRGWTEVRNPVPNFDKFDRSLEQMQSVLSGTPVFADSFIAVGGWPQNDADLYRNMVMPFKDKLDRKEVVIAISDASTIQRGLLREKLAHANVGQNPYEMGRQAILTLYKIVNQQDYEEIIYTPLLYCNQRNYEHCSNEL